MRIDTGTLVTWVVFVVAAAVLCWVLMSNRRRRAQWRRWCVERGWRILVDREGAPGAENLPGLPSLPLALSRFRRQSMEMAAAGLREGAVAATWEWQVVWRDMPRRGSGATLTNKMHAVALRVPEARGMSFCALPPHMRLLSASGVFALPAAGRARCADGPGWSLHTHEAARVESWLCAGGAAGRTPAKPPADLALLQAQDGWVVAWHLGETRLQRIDSALCWLAALASAGAGAGTSAGGKGAS